MENILPFIFIAVVVCGVAYIIYRNKNPRPPTPTPVKPPVPPPQPPPPTPPLV